MVNSTGTSNYKRMGAGVTDSVVSDGAATYTPGVSERRSGVTAYLHSGLKDADAQSGSSQTVGASRTYDAFGAVVSSSGTWKGPFGYAGSFGYQEDADTSYQLLGHRYYDASTGRFLTRDPVKDGRNWYAYCENSPLDGVDPDGCRRKRLIIVIGAPRKHGSQTVDGAYKYFGTLAGLYREKFDDMGWDVVPTMWQPNEKALAKALHGADGMVFIGHGSLDENYGRLQGEPRRFASQKVTSGLISKATRSPLHLLILESCNLGKGDNGEAWTKVARRVYAYDDFNYPGRRIEDWGKKGGYQPLELHK